MLCIYLLYRALCPALRRLVLILTLRKHRPVYGRKKAIESTARYGRIPRVPDWVVKELIRMKALMPDTGCRALAATFNRRFVHKGMSVGKSYVHAVLIKHRHEIALLRRNLKKKKPKPVPHNLTWGLDLTGKADSQGRMHNILGIVEHASRANLSLAGLKDKSTITLLRHLLDAVERYGKPKMIRTDNESIFTSRLFRLGLWLLGIKHQKTDKGCPWMNGRIVRLTCMDALMPRAQGSAGAAFGTLKAKLDNGKSILLSNSTARWVNSEPGTTLFGHIKISMGAPRWKSGKVSTSIPHDPEKNITSALGTGCWPGIICGCSR